MNIWWLRWCSYMHMYSTVELLRGMCDSLDSACCCMYCVPQVYDVNEGKMVQTLKGHRDAVHCLSYARDGKSETE